MYWLYKEMEVISVSHWKYSIYQRYPLSLFYMSMLHIQHLFTLSSKNVESGTSFSPVLQQVGLCVPIGYVHWRTAHRDCWIVCKWLEEASTDFRYGKAYLKGLRYAVFGLGNLVYGIHYNTVRDLTKYCMSPIDMFPLCVVLLLTLMKCNPLLCLSDTFMDIFAHYYIPLFVHTRILSSFSWLSLPLWLLSPVQ